MTLMRSLKSITFSNELLKVVGGRIFTAGGAKAKKEEGSATGEGGKREKEGGKREIVYKFALCLFGGVFVRKK